MGALEAVAIILSLVSLVISVVAFFASLKFYRDGVQLQQAANDALTQISEKTAFIQTQVGGMFDKTLDAAIGKREILSDQFEELNEQLERTKAKLIEESIGQIGAAGEQEQRRLSKIVDNQIALIREKIETTRESAQEMVEAQPFPLPPSLKKMLDNVSSAANGVTVNELAELQPQISPNGVRMRLHELRKRGLVERIEDKYFARAGLT